MHRGIIALAALLLGWTGTAAAQDRPPCREVGELPHIAIDPQAAVQLAQIGLDRAEIFQRMRGTSIPETMGCWAMPAGSTTSSSSCSTSLTSAAAPLSAIRAGGRH